MFALRKIVESRNLELLQQALANPERPWSEDELASALASAAWYQDVESVKRLLAHGANPSLNTKGRSPALHYAVGQENLEIIKLMLAAGADPNTTAAGDWTVLHSALDAEVDGAQQTQTEPTCDVTRLLLEHGANPLAADDRGLTPLDMARDGYHDEAVKLMERYLNRSSSV